MPFPSSDASSVHSHISSQWRFYSLCDSNFALYKCLQETALFETHVLASRDFALLYQATSKRAWQCLHKRAAVSKIRGET